MTCRKFQPILILAKRIWPRRELLQDFCLAWSDKMRLVSESNENLIGYIASTIEAMRDEMVTIRYEMATKQDLSGLEMATKQDLSRLEGRLSERLDASTTGIRGDIEQVYLRLESIEHGMSSRFEHVEGEISRLRSAVYLLGKDRPDVLRLLGQSSS